jgi:hypothetical protein
MTSPLPRGCSATELAGPIVLCSVVTSDKARAKPHPVGARGEAPIQAKSLGGQGRSPKQAKSLGGQGRSPKQAKSLGGQGRSPKQAKNASNNVTGVDPGPECPAGGGAPFGTCSRGAGAEPPKTKPAMGCLLRRHPRAGDGIRTRDVQLGRLTLYQLSYSRDVRLLPNAEWAGRRRRTATRGG